VVGASLSPPSAPPTPGARLHAWLGLGVGGLALLLVAASIVAYLALIVVGVMDRNGPRRWCLPPESKCMLSYEYPLVSEQPSRKLLRQGLIQT
jgi:hypothetical protein